MSKWLMRVMGGVWLLFLLVIPAVVDFHPSVLFAAVVFWPLAILAAIFIAGVFLWLTSAIVWSIMLHRANAFLFAITMLCLGLTAPFAGVMIGRCATVVVLYGPIQDAIGLENGSSPGDSKIDASPFAAVYKTDGSKDDIQGLAYDSTGKLGEMLPKRPADRPYTWQEKMPRSLQCGGSASHIWGNYWKVSLDLTVCIS